MRNLSVLLLVLMFCVSPTFASEFETVDAIKTKESTQSIDIAEANDISERIVVNPDEQSTDTEKNIYILAAQRAAAICAIAALACVISGILHLVSRFADNALSEENHLASIMGFLILPTFCFALLTLVWLTLEVNAIAT